MYYALELANYAILCCNAYCNDEIALTTCTKLFEIKFRQI